MQIKNVEIKHWLQMRILYKNSFPRAERKPFAMVKRLKREGKTEILELSDNGKFCGLLFTVICDDLILIDYLAVAPNIRGGGIGTKALSLIRERYKGKKIFLEIETTLKPSDNYEQRIKRKRFYTKNGLSECDFCVILFGVEMEILHFGNPITYDDYIRLYDYMAGAYALNNISRVND